MRGVSHSVSRRSSAVVLLALLLTGCAGPPAAPSPSGPALPEGVTASLIQLRSDVASRQAQVQITNGSDESILIGPVQVDDPRFDGIATRVIADRTSRLAPGARVDVRVALPPMTCPAPDGGGDSIVTISFEAGEEAGSATIPADDPLDFLGPLHARECRLNELADAASLAWTAFRPSESGEPADLELRITPTGDGAATVVGVQRTNLLDFDAETIDGAYPVDVRIEPGDDEPVVIHLPLVPFRCDPHAVQEDKRGTIFDVRIEVSGSPGEVELFVGEEMRAKILNWVAEWCRFGE